ncbi:MAG: pentapeptide repeat-containing protein [Cyanobacteria bacterium J06632_19]
MIWKITTDELLARYSAGERNFNGIELLRIVGEMGERDGIDGLITGLEGADLRGINLRGANLEKVDLSETNLTEADLFGAYLSEASLWKAILKDVNFFSANLSHANLSKADLTDATLSEVRAISTVFIGAKVSGFQRADLSEANFKYSTADEYNICRWFNLIWRTIMPDGTIKEGPHCVW